MCARLLFCIRYGNMAPSVSVSLGGAFGTASLTTVTLTVCANLVGAGLLSLPYSFLRAGVVPGVLGMLVTCVLNAGMMILIGMLCDKSKRFTYGDIALVAFGQAGAVIVPLVMAVYTMGTCVSLVVILGDFLPDLICQTGCEPGSARATLGNRDLLIVVMGIIALYPLSLKRDLSSLKFTTTLSAICILYTACLVVSQPFVHGVDSTVDYKGDITGLFVAFPILSVAFTLHYNVPKYYSELKDRTIGRLTAIVSVAFGVCLVCYLATALGGYLAEGSTTQPNILKDGNWVFPPTDGAAIFAKVALSVIVISCYPLAFNAMRISVMLLLPPAWKLRVSQRLLFTSDGRPIVVPTGGGKVSDDEQERPEEEALLSQVEFASTHGKGSASTGAAAASLPCESYAVRLRDSSHEETLLTSQEPTVGDVLRKGKPATASRWAAFRLAVRGDWPHAVLTALLVALSLGVALSVPNIAIVLTYKGALGASLIVYLIPCYMYFALVQRELHKKTDGELGDLVWSWGDLVKTRHGLLAVASTVLAAINMVCGVLAANNVIG